jgi:hypothetical protein
MAIQKKSIRYVLGLFSTCLFFIALQLFFADELEDTAGMLADPTFIATFLGGSLQDGGHMGAKVILGNSGRVFVTGYTASSDFPTTPGAYKKNKLTFSGDIFISRHNSNLENLEASTFLGGSGIDGSWPGTSLVVDGDGNIYVAGNTGSFDFPATHGAYDTTPNGGDDVFIAKLDKDLTTLKAATLLGGSHNESCWAVIRDEAGNIFVAGQTSSTNFPTSANAYDTSFNGEEDIFISKFDSSLKILIASTLLGASNKDWGNILAQNINGDIYIGGYTESSNFPTTPGAHDVNFGSGGYDACLSKFDTDLSQLLASTYLGGSGMDFIYAIGLKKNGSVFVAGHTSSSNFPTTAEAFDRSYNGTSAGDSDDAFITRLDESLSTIQASTFLGGSGWENVSSLAFDINGDIFVAGNTQSIDFPTSEGAYDTNFHGGTLYAADVFIAKLEPDLTNLLASTYLGGSDNDNLGAITVAPEGYVIAAGGTSSPDFPATDNSYDNTYNGGRSEWGADVFIAKFNNQLSAKWPFIDLSALLVKIKPKRPKLEKKITLICKVTNLGKTKSYPTTLDFYLSKKKKLKKKAIQIGEAALDSIAPGKKKTIKLRGYLPKNIAAGSYYLIASADSDNLNHDSKKANNKAVAGKKVVIE